MSTTEQSEHRGGPLSGRATEAGTRRYRERFAGADRGHFRTKYGLSLASVGIGTYLGEPDERTDLLYRQSVRSAVERGANVIDTAINYRFQRSERAIGHALQELKAAGFGREEIVVATKAGYLSFDGRAPADPRGYLSRTYIETGILRPEEIAGGAHSIAPRYLDDQIERSLRNLNLETIDIFYLHNPETQLDHVTPAVFFSRIQAAFERLESAVQAGKIQMYGVATWNAFRSTPAARGYVRLADLERAAQEAAGPSHHFRAIQLPYNLAMPEALTLKNQAIAGEAKSILEAASELGLIVMASASLLQARLARNLPEALAGEMPGLLTHAQRAIQFVRSTPGIDTALVGMSRPEHVDSNLAVAGAAPLAATAVRALAGC